MDFFQVVRQRRSIRSYSCGEVAESDIEQILIAASLAPTARNIQPWEFIVTRDSSLKQKLSELVAPNGAFLSHAAVCISVFCKDTKYYLEDGSAATTQALLAASACGLGACWIAGDKKDYADKVGMLLGVPSGYKLVSLIACGPVRETAAPVEKRNLKDMVHQEKF